MSNGYTIIDCLVLMDILRSIDNLGSSLEFFDSVIDRARKKITTTELGETHIKDFIIDWVRDNYRNDMANKVVEFLFNKSIEEVPLFINDTDMRPFMKWRLQISK